MSSQRKTAIVTGASQGIGAGVVKAFAERGFNVVANSLKHAFPANRPGRVWVRMEADDRACTLRVGDDGAGLPAGTDFRQAQTLGLQVVRTLTDQLEGALSHRNQGGSEFTVTFPRRKGGS